VKSSIAAILFLFISTGPLAQTPAQVVASPRGEFQMAYSPPLVRCERRSTEPADGGAWLPKSSCRSDVCEDQDSPSAGTVVCLAYAGEEFSEKVAFGAGAIFVAEVQESSAEISCQQGQPGWIRRRTGKSTIADAPAAQFHASERWMMHSRDSVIYRVFHRGKCYEIGIQRVHNSTGPYEPGTFQEFTPQDEAKVQQRLGQALRTFRFLN
jgi:hypothetical protein